MINNETYKLYLQDLCTLLKEDAALAYRHRNESDMDKGIIHGYYRILSTIKHQFEVFGIDEKDFKMEDFDPDDLLYDKFHYSLSDSAIELDKRGRKIVQEAVKRLHKDK